MKHILEDTDISLMSIHNIMQLSTPPWPLEKPVVILNLNKLTKNKTHPLIYKEELYNIQEKHPNHLHIFTDGSKNSNGTWCGAFSRMLPKKASIFTAEISAIHLAVKIVSTSNLKKSIHSGSISVSQSIENRKLDNPLIVKLLNKLNSINHHKNVIFCWIPSHMRFRKW